MEMDRVMESAAAESEAISAELNAATGAAAIDAAIESNKEATKAAKESTQRVIDSIEANAKDLSEKDKQLLEASKATLADGELTMQEQRDNHARLTSIMRTIRTDFKTQTNLMQEWVILNTALAGDVTRLKAELATMKRMLSTPSRTY
jgi:hypothetical protein